MPGEHAVVLIALTRQGEAEIGLWCDACRRLLNDDGTPSETQDGKPLLSVDEMSPADVERHVAAHRALFEAEP